MQGVKQSEKSVKSPKTQIYFMIHVKIMSLSPEIKFILHTYK